MTKVERLTVQLLAKEKELEFERNRLNQLEEGQDKERQGRLVSKLEEKAQQLKEKLEGLKASN